MEYNDYQKAFLKQTAVIQETAVQLVLGQRGYGEGSQDIRALLYDATGHVLAALMELIDGYSDFPGGPLDLVNPKTSQRLKENPFIELHDAIYDYIKFE